MNYCQVDNGTNIRSLTIQKLMCSLSLNSFQISEESNYRDLKYDIRFSYKKCFNDIQSKMLLRYSLHYKEKGLSLLMNNNVRQITTTTTPRGPYLFMKFSKPKLRRGRLMSSMLGCWNTFYHFKVSLIFRYVVDISK